MGAKQSKSGKPQQNGTEAAAAGDDLDTFNKTQTLPASYREGIKEDVKNGGDDVTKTGTLPREGAAQHEANTSFSKRFRRSVSKLIGKDDKSPKKEVCQDAVTANGDASSPVKDQDKTDSPAAAKTPVDHKLAQKIARAKFFQDLYTTPTNVPKPPRSHNLSFDKESVGEEGVDGKLTPVVKLIEKHQEAIEKHQEEIRNSMSSPDVLKERMDSFRRSKLIENSIEQKTADVSSSVTKQEVSVSQQSASVSQSSKVEERKVSQSSTVETMSSTSEVQKSETICEESSVQKMESQHIAESMQVTSSESVSMSSEVSEMKAVKTEEVSMVSEVKQMQAEVSESCQVTSTSESCEMKSEVSEAFQMTSESASLTVESVTNESCTIESQSSSAVESYSETVQQSESLSTQDFSQSSSEVKTSQVSEESCASETVNNSESAITTTTETEEALQETKEQSSDNEKSGENSGTESEPEQ